MSNEPVRNQASFDDSADRPAPRRPAVPLRTSLAADAELVLSAIHRIEAAIDNGLATPPMDRLRALVDEMARDIAEARLAIALDHEYGARTLNIEMLLERLDGRIAGMMAATSSLSIAGEAEPADQAVAADQPSSVAAPEPDRVPTVSGVVAHLSREAEMPATPPAGRPPSLSILEAMVEALATSANRNELAGDQSISLMELIGPESVDALSANAITEPVALDALPSPASQLEPAPTDHPSEEISLTVAPLADAANALAAWEPVEDEAPTEPVQGGEAPPIATTTHAPEPEPAAVPPATNSGGKIAISAPAPPAIELSAAETPASDTPTDAPADLHQATETSAPAPGHPDELLSRFAEMEAKVYLPQDIGEAVIFARAASTDVEPVAGASPEAADLTESSEDDGAPADFLLGPAPESQAPQQPPQTAAKPAPAMPMAAQLIVPKAAARIAPPADPLAPLRLLSESETVALFS